MSKTGVSICTHHWRIEEPRGEKSMGLCLKCGQYKEFKNVSKGSTWGEYIMELSNAAR